MLDLQMSVIKTAIYAGFIANTGTKDTFPGHESSLSEGPAFISDSSTFSVEPLRLKLRRSKSENRKKSERRSPNLRAYPPDITAEPWCSLARRMRRLRADPSWRIQQRSPDLPLSDLGFFSDFDLRISDLLEDCLTRIVEELIPASC